MNGFRPYDALDAFDALPQNQAEPMSEADEREALDALLGISRDTAPLTGDEIDWIFSQIGDDEAALIVPINS